MAWPKGKPRPTTSGRKAGTPNKKTLLFAEVCEQEGMDFAAALVKIAKDPEHPNHWDAVKEGIQYVFPKRKAVEVSGNLDVRLQQELESLMKLSEEELRALLKDESK